MTYFLILSILNVEVIVTKISFTNNDFFKENKDSKLKSTRKSKIGPIFLAVAIAGTTIAFSHEKQDVVLDYNVPSISTLTKIEYDNNEINSLNIIINDDDCSDNFFRSVCDKLEEDGIVFTIAKNSFDIDRDNCTVVTLDQQYSAGENTLIYAPYDNSRVGHSDSLAVAMKSGFEKNGFLINGLSCSQIGYVQDEKGNVCCNVPTDTEKVIDINNNTSFVTISFGTQNVDPELVVKSIEEGLARQKHFLDSEDSKIDLVYRANGDEDINVVSDYFGVNSSELKAYNNFNNSTLSDSQAIINPQVEKIDSFSKDCDITITKVHNKIFQ